ncbi:MAG: hypothetical protein KBA70_03675 [Aquabacterium sp.]|uniref:hypothetical protein n=1 Tax=Aquabacterium sp. TaxID=1872578 RepID=UPI001B71AA77|nr:hypothetical protein [Aquabacterium sp.]MBP7131841.1 hypothetical protein [Aquabacterium sp.]
MTTTTRRESVSTFYRPIQGITVTHIKQMYDLYASFYENTALDVFLQDLSKKSGVILVTRKSDEKVVGFSTLTCFDIEVEGRNARGIFSGDTIIEPAYWGNNALAATFHRRVVIERLKKPFTPFYWFLISKGYKTYLLLANNFYNYYPNVNGGDARYRRVTEAYCNALLPEAFDRERMVLDFGHDYVRLKGDVAEITPELKAANPHIAFFDRINPEWRRGTELPCVGSVDYESVLRSMIDMPLKWVRKHLLKTHRPAGLDIATSTAKTWQDTDVASDALDRQKAT